jgi:hypothetical protein
LGEAPDPLPGLLRGAGLAVPESKAERVAAWRTYTAGRRVLVVVDGARDADQVRPVFSSGAAVVITARQRLFGLPSMQWLTLDQFTPDEARTLLERVVGVERVRAEPAAVDRLIEVTEGLPQVLRAVGTRMATRPNWTFAIAEKRIGRPDPGELQPVECAEIEKPYESALNELTHAQARAFRLLALADSPDIAIDAAAALLDVTVTGAETLLESLVDTYLIEPSGLDRYRYRLPLRVFARSHAVLDDGEEECQAALARLVRFYATSVKVS